MEEFDPAKVKKIIFSPHLERVLKKCKKKDHPLFSQLSYEMEKIINDPTVGKPLRYALKNRRRVHIGSFVLVYEFYDGELRFLDFDHHDRVYKK
jgi:mRNA-degrading endonuclease RelE of RelBE toxin-antitoxin system